VTTVHIDTVGDAYRLVTAQPSLVQNLSNAPVRLCMAISAPSANTEAYYILAAKSFSASLQGASGASLYARSSRESDSSILAVSSHEDTWILNTGIWDDSGIWVDEASWNDGV
jgi:hypothetical protein